MRPILFIPYWDDFGSKQSVIKRLKRIITDEKVKTPEWMLNEGIIIVRVNFKLKSIEEQFYHQLKIIEYNVRDNRWFYVRPNCIKKFTEKYQNIDRLTFIHKATLRGLVDQIEVKE